jgi:hypothetical protein
MNAKLGTKFAFIATCVIWLSGCEPTTTLMSRSTGEIGTGVVENVTFGSSGVMTVQFRDELYSGNWISVRDSGSSSFGSINAYSTTGASAYGNFSRFSRSDSGFGTALLSSDRGNSMRCELRYSLVTVTAIGVCQRQDGELFDLQIG